MKITLEQREKIKELIKSGATNVSIAKIYGVYPSTIGRVLKKRISQCIYCNKEYYKIHSGPSWCSDRCRFWNYVDKKSEKECWPWTSTRIPNSYGRFHLGKNKSIIAPRFAYQDFNNIIISRELDIRHKCDNPICCNPHHLEIGTRKDNMQDASKRKRIKNNPGKHHSKPDLTTEQIQEIRTCYIKGNPNFSLKALGRKYNVHFITISKIIHKIGSWSKV